MGPLTPAQRATYYALRVRLRRCVGCSDRLMPDDPRRYCEPCRGRQAQWQRRRRRRRAAQARAYRQRVKQREVRV